MNSLSEYSFWNLSWVRAYLRNDLSLIITLEQRDELTRSLGTLIEAVDALLVDDVNSMGASNAVLHGAQTWEQMAPFITEAVNSTPR